MTLSVLNPRKELAAVCGLFCPSCAVYIATHENPERLKEQAAFLNLTVEETKCNGCRSDKRNGTCETCFMLKCASGKNLDFCVDCEEYPCNELKKWQAKMPHRIELWKDLERIKNIGWEQWYVEQLGNYKCQQCGTINTAWDMVCRTCAYEPSSNYVANNAKEIKRRL